jgi:hypothetical protein
LVDVIIGFSPAAAAGAAASGCRALAARCSALLALSFCSKASTNKTRHCHRRPPVVSVSHSTLVRAFRYLLRQSRASRRSCPTPAPPPSLRPNPLALSAPPVTGSPATPPAALVDGALGPAAAPLLCTPPNNTAGSAGLQRQRDTFCRTVLPRVFASSQFAPNHAGQKARIGKTSECLPYWLPC